jgi:glycosyltransferase involved in cell wall biosynthesis
MPPRAPAITVVVPARDAAATLDAALSAWNRSAQGNYELIVVDDASKDGTSEAAARRADRVLRFDARRGPAAARNAGARAGRGEILFFVDADVRVDASAAARILRVFRENPGLAAVFGSYDDRPSETNFLSQFKNLFHHFVHQRAQEDAGTFWAGCGAVRRNVFLEAGGFSETYASPSIEDVEFGYRLKASGRTIRLLKDLQGTHLKRWTLARLLRSDISGRAIPWTRLAWERGLPRDLNFLPADRLSAVLAWVLLIGLASGALNSLWLIPAAGAGGLLLVVNRPLYRFFRSKRGLWFAARAVLWHWFYLLYASGVFAIWTPVLFINNIFGRKDAGGG